MINVIMMHYWKLALHIASLPEHRWVGRILAWNQSICSMPIFGKEAAHLTKSMRFVDTNVTGHGWRRRNSTNNGLRSFQGFRISAKDETSLCIIYGFFLPPVPKIGLLCGGQAWTMDH